MADLGLVEKLSRGKRRLGAGQCQGFKLLPVLGGDHDTDDVYATSLAEYWAFCGDVHPRIDGLPEGAPIKIRIP